MDYIFETKNLTKKYGKKSALDGINIKIPKGAIVGLVGRNGAGKTTLLRTLCGIVIPTDGSFELFGIDNKSKKINEVRKRTGALVDTPFINEDKTVLNNLKYQYLLLGINDNGRINEIIEEFGLTKFTKTKAKKLSLGYRQRLGIAVAICGNPDLVVLDEPMIGLDPETVIWLREYILKQNKNKDITFIISSHMLEELSKVATYYCFIDEGKLVCELSAEELAEKQRKKVTLKVTDINVLTNICEEQKIEYEVVANDTIAIFGDIRLSDLIVQMSQKGCEATEITECNESLENFYLTIMGE